MPPNIKKGRQVKADIKSKHIQVSILESDGKWNVLVDNALTWDVNKEESMWTLVPGEFVHVSILSQLANLEMCKKCLAFTNVIIWFCQYLNTASTFFSLSNYILNTYEISPLSDD